jgi:molybdenum cofactor biosynthesis protein B
MADDRSGDRLVERLTGCGPYTGRAADRARRCRRDRRRLHAWIDDPQVEVVLTTGGTGVTGRDVTPEALARVWDKEIPGFGELFRWLSYQSIGTSTIQSRATAGVARGTYIFALPGSTGAVTDAWDGILASQLDIRHKPCNFVELMPRLRSAEARLRFPQAAPRRRGSPTSRSAILGTGLRRGTDRSISSPA